MINKFIEWAKNNNWNVTLNSDVTDLPDIIKKTI